MQIPRAVDETLRYLNSAEALRSLADNPYWPKWDSPWWHMLTLHELGLAHQIPRLTAERMAEAIDSQCLHFFPIRPEELPPGVDPALGVMCHCGLGSIYQVLSAAGLDLDQRYPWMREWFVKYPLPDGGMNCDEAAYLDSLHPSSMVALIAPLEAVLFYASQPFTLAEEKFLDEGARNLMGRKLMRGTHEEERQDEADWLGPCFPRFYFYDVLRGLSWLVKWAEVRGKELPWQSIEPVMTQLSKRFPDGVIRNSRILDEVGSREKGADGIWVRTRPAPRFKLMDEVSEVGQEAPVLSMRWREARAGVERLRGRGLLI